MRVKFDKVFYRKRDGSYTPFSQVGYKGLVLSPGHILWPAGNLQDKKMVDIIGRDIEIVDSESGGKTIIKIY